MKTNIEMELSCPKCGSNLHQVEKLLICDKFPHTHSFTNEEIQALRKENASLGQCLGCTVQCGPD